MLPKRGWRWPLYDSSARRGSHSLPRVSRLAGRTTSPARGRNAARVQVAAAIASARSMFFLLLRARKAVVAAGSVRDGP